MEIFFRSTAHISANFCSIFATFSPYFVFLKVLSEYIDEIKKKQRKPKLFVCAEKILHNK